MRNPSLPVPTAAGSGWAAAFNEMPRCVQEGGLQSPPANAVRPCPREKSPAPLTSPETGSGSVRGGGGRRSGRTGAQQPPETLVRNTPGLGRWTPFTPQHSSMSPQARLGQARDRRGGSSGKDTGGGGGPASAPVCRRLLFGVHSTGWAGPGVRVDLTFAWLFFGVCSFSFKPKIYCRRTVARLVPTPRALMARTGRSGSLVLASRGIPATNYFGITSAVSHRVRSRHVMKFGAAAGRGGG